MIVVAIDPGIDGAAAALDDSCGLFQDVIDLPTRIVGKRREIDVRRLSSWMYHLMPRRVVIEEVHSMPRDGRVGSFNFGVTYGMLRAVSLLATNQPPEFVSPQKWKAYFHLISEDKAASRGLALRLWPDQDHVLTRVKDHNRAEAMLIAWWSIRPPIGRNW